MLRSKEVKKSRLGAACCWLQRAEGKGSRGG
jgi:hypothetical protein